MTKYSLKTLLSMHLAAGLFLTPTLALADNNTIQLKPLQDTGGYTNTYSNNAYSTSAYNNNNAYNANATSNNAGGYGASGSSYGTPSYYSPDSNPTLQGRVISIPKGTLLSIHTDMPISSFGTHMGDPVNASLENDVFVNDAVAIPAGSQVLGQIANVTPAGHLGKHGEIDVRFDGVKLPDGKVVPIHAHLVTHDESGVLKGDSYTMDIAKGVGISAGSAGVGTLMGTAAGGLLGSVGTGALFGLGVGALGGMGYAVARKGKEVIVPSGARMSVVIDSPVTVNN